MNDRQEVYESQRRGRSSLEAPERDRQAEADHIVQSAILLIEAFEKRGFERDVAIMMCSQILPKFL